tara:strand:- start:258 stop:605 length:348 start_codon:yes stop_codon:yes gene_type:complete
MDFKYVYKICTIDEWENAKKNGYFKGTKKDVEDGFIHFSDKEQVKGTLNKFFFQKDNLVLLKVDASKLKNLIYEQISDGNMFPHLYDSFKISSVLAEHKIQLNDTRSHIIPLEII